MTAARISPWLRRVLVVVAHEDDETACSVLLQRLREVQIVFATDGAPTSEFSWHNYGDRDQNCEADEQTYPSSVLPLEPTCLELEVSIAVQYSVHCSGINEK